MPSLLLYKHNNLLMWQVYVEWRDARIAQIYTYMYWLDRPWLDFKKYLIWIYPHIYECKCNLHTFSCIMCLNIFMHAQRYICSIKKLFYAIYKQFPSTLKIISAACNTLSELYQASKQDSVQYKKEGMFTILLEMFVILPTPKITTMTN